MSRYEEIEKLITSLIIAADREPNPAGLLTKHKVQTIEEYITQLHKRIEELEAYEKHSEERWEQVKCQFRAIRRALDGDPVNCKEDN